MFDFSDVKSDDVIPEGTYHLAVYEAKLKDGKKDRDNKVLSLQLKIMDGDHKGRRFFENFNIVHKNEQTRGIAVNQLQRLQIAAGKTKEEVKVLKSLDDLTGLQFLGQVKIQAAEGAYPARNALGRCSPLDLMAGSKEQTSDIPF